MAQVDDDTHNLAIRVAEAHAEQRRKAREADEKRERLEREAINKRNEEARARHEAAARLQREWSARRDELQTEVEQFRRLLLGARGQVLDAPIEEARVAAADVAVYEKRLAVAEQALAAHARQQPVIF